jgi:hypothetical protein
MHGFKVQSRRMLGEPCRLSPPHYGEHCIPDLLLSRFFPSEWLLTALCTRKYSCEVPTPLLTCAVVWPDSLCKQPYALKALPFVVNSIIRKSSHWFLDAVIDVG